MSEKLKKLRKIIHSCTTLDHIEVVVSWYKRIRDTFTCRERKIIEDAIFYIEIKHNKLDYYIDEEKINENSLV